MNDGESNLQPWIEPELEARIIALVLGEASDFEAGELERLIEERPELAVFRNRMEAMHGLLEEVAAADSEDARGEWKLSEDRRNAVLAAIGAEPAAEAEAAGERTIDFDPGKDVAPSAGEPDKAVPSGRTRSFPWRSVVNIAAVLCLVGIVISILVPFSLKRMLSSRAIFAHTEDSDLDEGWGALSREEDFISGDRLSHSVHFFETVKDEPQVPEKWSGRHRDSSLVTALDGGTDVTEGLEQAAKSDPEATAATSLSLLSDTIAAFPEPSAATGSAPVIDSIALVTDERNPEGEPDMPDVSTATVDRFTRTNEEAPDEKPAEADAIVMADVDAERVANRRKYLSDLEAQIEELGETVEGEVSLEHMSERSKQVAKGARKRESAEGMPLTGEPRSTLSLNGFVAVEDESKSKGIQNNTSGGSTSARQEERLERKERLSEEKLVASSPGQRLLEEGRESVDDVLGVPVPEDLPAQAAAATTPEPAPEPTAQPAKPKPSPKPSSKAKAPATPSPAVKKPAAPEAPKPEAAAVTRYAAVADTPERELRRDGEAGKMRLGGEVDFDTAAPAPPGKEDAGIANGDNALYAGFTTAGIKEEEGKAPAAKEVPALGEVPMVTKFFRQSQGQDQENGIVERQADADGMPDENAHLYLDFVRGGDQIVDGKADEEAARPALQGGMGKASKAKKLADADADGDGLARGFAKQGEDAGNKSMRQSADNQANNWAYQAPGGQQAGVPDPAGANQAGFGGGGAVSSSGPVPPPAATPPTPEMPAAAENRPTGETSGKKNSALSFQWDTGTAKDPLGDDFTIDLNLDDPEVVEYEGFINRGSLNKSLDRKEAGDVSDLQELTEMDEAAPPVDASGAGREGMLFVGGGTYGGGSEKLSKLRSANQAGSNGAIGGVLADPDAPASESPRDSLSAIRESLVTMDGPQGIRKGAETTVRRSDRAETSRADLDIAFTGGLLQQSGGRTQSYVRMDAKDAGDTRQWKEGFKNSVESKEDRGRLSGSGDQTRFDSLGLVDGTVVYGAGGELMMDTNGESRTWFATPGAVAAEEDKKIADDYDAYSRNRTRSEFLRNVAEGWELPVPASITGGTEVVREFIYPTEYDPPEIPNAVSFQNRVAPPAGLDEKNAAEESFSTFSLHVSDVSFKLALSTLAKGEWPEAGKVRIEEFVNAFDYGDPHPSQEDKVACRVEQAVHPFLQQRNLMRVAMRTAAAGRAGDTPLRLTFLLDNSGSMERADREETVRRAFALLADQLQPIDQVTLISFARQPRLLADKVTGDQSKSLVEVVSNLPSEGGTNLEAALKLAFEKAQEQKTDKAQNRIVLLTDGAANLGNARPESLSAMIESMREEGIAFDAAGIGADGLNDEILEALTRKGDGRYYLLDRPEDADAGFAKQIAGALRPAAKNVKVQVEFNPERVGHYKLLGFEKHLLKKEDFRDDSVDAAEMAAEEAGVAVYQFEARPDGKGDVGFVSVRFRDMSSGEMVEKRWPIPYEPGAPRPDQAAPSMQVATAAALLAAKLNGEPLGETVELGELSQMVSSLPEPYRSKERVGQLRQMIQQARDLAAP